MLEKETFPKSTYFEDLTNINVIELKIQIYF